MNRVSGEGRPGGGLREQRKARTRREIQRHALRLFLKQGYDATTVQQIAAAAGVSHMTFFRYFASKEAVVENDDYDPMITELIRSRPADEGPLTAVHRAISEGLTAVLATDRETVLARARLITSTPALRARQWRNMDATVSLLVDALADREGDQAGFRLRVIAYACATALTAAITEWARRDGVDDPAELVEQAFRALAGLEFDAQDPDT